MLPTERLENVKASVFKYIADNYTETPVDYEGVGIDEENQDEWVRVDIILASQRMAGRVGNNLNGSEPTIMVNMNIIRKQTETETVNVYRPTRIRDTLANLFRVPLGIPVRDWADNAGANVIGVLQTSELGERYLGLVESQASYQHNLTSTLRYVFAWSA